MATYEVYFYIDAVEKRSIVAWTLDQAQSTAHMFLKGLKPKVNQVRGIPTVKIINVESGVSRIMFVDAFGSITSKFIGDKNNFVSTSNTRRFLVGEEIKNTRTGQKAMVVGTTNKRNGSVHSYYVETKAKNILQWGASHVSAV